jgi:hypothetical protein
LTAPSCAATSTAADGVWYGCVTVASMTMPICSGSMPDWASALRAAATARSTTDSSGAAQRRSMMPDRSRIHSSVESMRSQISSLVTTRSGR